jgi:EAL domain-containing protein (putative c-di-GMP-specific phosphodiesterase class I)
MAELRDAIEREQLVLHYQPKIDLRTGRPVAAEALVRWQHPRNGLLMPDQFIEACERTGLIKALTRWVLETAMRECRTFRRKEKTLRVSVNLSARSLHDPHLAEQVAELLRTAGLAPGLLELEITESASVLEPQRAMETLAALNRLGVLISIDDFGTGYTSLAYIRRLPVSEIKIDKSFVANMLSDEGDATIVRSVIELGHNLGLKVVAEGVENQAVLDRLVDIGCDYAQGYHIGRPAPMEELEAWLRGV